jgi:hypothetical protein
MKPRNLIPALLIASLGLGCSAFDRDWKKAAGQPQTGIEGRWIGQWKSKQNQHQGVLRCLIDKTEDNLYETRFHAKYKWGILTVGFPYTMEMNIKQDGAEYQFTGEADLGKLAGGVYQYKGSGSTNQLIINFRSPKDHGTFHLQRPREAE